MLNKTRRAIGKIKTSEVLRARLLSILTDFLCGVNDRREARARMYLLRETGKFSSTNEHNVQRVMDAFEEESREANPAAVLGARGGAVNSKAQQAAARANGAKGGRPRKNDTGET